MTMQMYVAALACSIAIATGCAMTNETRSDGQTHWMKACDTDDDCGELSCICRVCTEACDADDGCSPEGAICAAQSAIFGEGECVASTPMRICAPAPRAGDPATISCTPQGELEGSGNYDIVLSDLTLGTFAIDDGGTVYASVGEEGDESIARVTEPDRSLSGIGNGVEHVGMLKVDGNELFAARWPPAGTEFIVTKIDLSTQQASEVARLTDMVGGHGFDVDAEWLYWSGEHVSSRPVNEIRRSARGSGESHLLGSVNLQMLPGALAVLDDEVFVAGKTSNTEFALYRLSTDGSRAPELVELPADARGLRTIESDGKSLYLALWSDRNGLEPVGLEGIARLDPSTNELVMLAIAEGRPISIVAGESDIYWSADTGVFSEEGPHHLVRTPKDGSASELLASVTGGYAVDVAEHDGTVYWAIQCFSREENRFTGRHVVSARAR
jgi:hypothetical protein